MGWSSCVMELLKVLEAPKAGSEQVRVRLGLRSPTHPHRLSQLQTHAHQGLPTPGYSLQLGLRSVPLRALTDHPVATHLLTRGSKTMSFPGNFYLLTILNPFAVRPPTTSPQVSLPYSNLDRSLPYLKPNLAFTCPEDKPKLLSTDT